MKKHYIQQASPQGWTPPSGQNSCLRYPAPEVTPDTLIDNVAGHRTGTGFTLSRILDFRDPVPEPRVRGGQAGKRWAGHGWRNQQSLRQYYMENVHESLEAGDCFVMLVIPPCYDLQTIYWQNYCEVEGLEMTIRMQNADLDIATMSGDDLACGYFDIPDEHRMRADKNEVIEVCIDAFPPKNEDLCERPLRYGVLGDASFLVSAAGRCISSGK